MSMHIAVKPEQNQVPPWTLERPTPAPLESKAVATVLADAALHPVSFVEGWDAGTDGE